LKSKPIDGASAFDRDQFARDESVVLSRGTRSPAATVVN
jgi:hypothetical protein